MTQPVDSGILHEIVRIVESRRKVPDKVIVASKEYLLIYLEDHRHRLEEALMRFDADRLNMLYGQLASKVKYQLLRRIPAKAAAAMGLSAAKPTKPAAKAPVAKKPARQAPPARAAKTAAKKAAPAKKKAAPAKKKAAAVKKKTAAVKKKAVVAKTKPAAPKKAKAAVRRAAARPKKKSRR